MTMGEQIKVYVVHDPGKTNLVMRYRDPMTGRLVKRTTGTTSRREAEKRAAQWEAELREGRYHAPSRVTWEEFRQRYEAEHLSGLALKTQQTGRGALNHLERVLSPKQLEAVTSAAISRFVATLRVEGMKPITIASVLGHLRPALSWAVSMGFLRKMPEIKKPHRSKGQSFMRGRPLILEEFERMLVAVPKVRPHDAATWQRYLQGLWLSGLRLEESLVLSWDEDAPIAIDLSGRYPRLKIHAEAEKGHRDRLLPLAPDFVEWLLATPEAERRGRVFRLDGLNTNSPITPKRVCRTVSAIGRRAGVVVNKAEGKNASAHDLRRSFATRWASKVRPATLQLLMRHRSIETTLRYYVAMDSDEVADELWAAHAGGEKAGFGPLLGPSGLGTPKREEKVRADETT